MTMNSPTKNCINKVVKKNSPSYFLVERTFGAQTINESTNPPLDGDENSFSGHRPPFCALRSALKSVSHGREGWWAGEGGRGLPARGCRTDHQLRYGGQGGVRHGTSSKLWLEFESAERGRRHAKARMPRVIFQVVRGQVSLATLAWRILSPAGFIISGHQIYVPWIVGFGVWCLSLLSVVILKWRLWPTYTKYSSI